MYNVKRKIKAANRSHGGFFVLYGNFSGVESSSKLESCKRSTFVTFGMEKETLQLSKNVVNLYCSCEKRESFAETKGSRGDLRKEIWIFRSEIDNWVLENAVELPSVKKKGLKFHGLKIFWPFSSGNFCGTKLFWGSFPSNVSGSIEKINLLFLGIFGLSEKGRWLGSKIG